MLFTGLNNTAVITVSELNRQVSSIIGLNLPWVRIRGEISNLKISASQHVYFTLKDSESQVSTVLFRSAASKLKFRLEDGLEVIIAGEVGLYEKRGEFRLVAQALEPAGIGALQLAFEQLKARLEAEGLFAASRKRAIPRFPLAIGVVTSDRGAAIRDILNILRRRMPAVKIILVPVPVQGEDAPAAIAAALRDLNEAGNTDVIIVGRGGGSLEDLWAFNEEIVARAIAVSAIPVISAVGHETDFTISDFVADMRAPTPSAAAELAAPDRAELQRDILMKMKRVRSSMFALLQLRQSELRVIHEGYVLRRFPEELAEYHNALQNSITVLDNLFRTSLAAMESKFISSVSALDMLSPLATLQRGYGIVRSIVDGRIVKHSDQLAIGEEVDVILFQGGFKGNVTEVRNESLHG
ncbi:MAG: exodeoxyribonuclease VII large subunit [bacterium]|nr:exodeoxyribonuclease VII large subunit [bacterium]MDD3805499.1 exodeoxyribonuclease VII large subunit [bacterium]MDD4557398.1 exodeoxyribonuclease VII large subunit [bacterium]